MSQQPLDRSIKKIYVILLQYLKCNCLLLSIPYLLLEYFVMITVIESTSFNYNSNEKPFHKENICYPTTMFENEIAYYYV